MSYTEQQYRRIFLDDVRNVGSYLGGVSPVGHAHPGVLHHRPVQRGQAAGETRLPHDLA